MAIAGLVTGYKYNRHTPISSRYNRAPGSVGVERGMERVEVEGGEGRVEDGMSGQGVWRGGA